MNADFKINGRFLRTDRVFLRPFTLEDVDSFYEYASVDGVGEMAGWKHHESIDESLDVLEMFIKEDKVFAICLAKTGKVIGSIGVEKYDMESALTEFDGYQGREIGYALSKDYWGQGIMPEAVKCVIDYLFNELDYDFLTCGYYDFNSQSKRVQEKCGFKPYRKLKMGSRLGEKYPGVLNLLINPNKDIKFNFSHPETLIYSEDDEKSTDMTAGVYMNSKKIKYALYDMDGTIINSLFFWKYKWNQFGEKYLNQKGYYAPADLDRAVRTKKMKECALLAKATFKLDVPDDEIIEFFEGDLLDFYKNQCNIKPGIEESIKYFFENGVKVGVATATATPIARKAMEHFGLLQYLSIVVSCADEDVNMGKESPKVYEKALRLLGADADETVIFEDSDLAVNTAKSLGIHTVGVEDKLNFNSENLKKSAEIFIEQGDNIFTEYMKHSK